MSDARPSVPPDVKRILRREAGYGCCHCGHPFIQYHHIIPWAEDQHSRPDDMMVLCGQCHHLCTVGALDEGQQRKIKASPKNQIDGFVRGKLYTKSTQLTVRMGNSLAVETPNILTIKDELIVGLRRNPDDSRILVSATIHDKSGSPIGVLRDNEWELPLDDMWDFEAYHLHATIRHGLGDIAFLIDARDEEIKLRGQWYHQGQGVIFSPSVILVGGARINGFTSMYGQNFISIG